MEAKFAVDGMLGSLARKLRIYGFDVLYDAKAEDSTILEWGRRDGRVILTSDRDLFRAAIKEGLGSVLCLGESDEDRLLLVFKSLKIRLGHLLPKISRCPVCNGTLKVTEGSGLAHMLPKNVIRAHKEFYICTSCGKAYWEGSHWRRISALLKRVNQRIMGA